MPGYAVQLRNAQLDAITTRAGNGAKLRAYTAPQPATGGAATTLLAEWTLGTPFAAGAAGGVLSPTLPADTTGIANGVADWFRIVQSDGTTFVMDLRRAEVTMASQTVIATQPARVTGFQITAGNA